jgi:hypothetical protein
MSTVVTALVLVGACCVGVSLVLVVGRATRSGRRRRAERRAAELRPLLLAVAAGEDPEGSARQSLRDLPPSRHAELVDAAVSLLAKVRGGPAEDLVDVLEHHGAVAEAVRGLTSRSAVRRARSARLLGLVRSTESVQALLPLLGDPSAEVRIVAAQALGLIGDPQAAPAIIEATRAVRGRIGIPVPAVAEGLGAMGPAVVGALHDGLRSDDPGARNVCAIVAGHGLFTSAAPWLRILLASDPEPDVRVTAAHALGQVGGTEDVGALSRSTHQEHAAVLRRAAAGALGELGDRHGIRTLVDLLPDPDRRLAEVSAQALVQVGARGVEQLQDAAALADDSSASPRDRRAGRAARGVLEIEYLRQRSVQGRS